MASEDSQSLWQKRGMVSAFTLSICSGPSSWLSSWKLPSKQFYFERDKECVHPATQKEKHGLLGKQDEA